MFEAVEGIYAKMTGKLEDINQKAIGILQQSQQALEVITNALAEIKKVAKKQPPTGETEIMYYRDVTPKFLTEYVYYGSVYNIEASIPVADSKGIRKYYKKEVDRIKSFFKQHQEFYRYLRSGKTHCDENYYTLKHNKEYVAVDVFGPAVDQDLFTLQSVKKAFYYGYERLVNYLGLQINILDGKENQQSSNTMAPLHWKAPAIALGELTIMLHASDVFPNMTLNTVASKVSQAFGIKLPNISKMKEEISLRKTKQLYMQGWLKNLQNVLDEENDKML